MIVGCDALNKHRICTTVSQKHWELLKKHVDTYGTQQQALESALENLANTSRPSAALSREDEIWMALSTVEEACLIQKDAFKLLLKTADMELFEEYVKQNKPIEFTIEYYFQKPMRECTLNEVIEGLVASAKMSHTFDTIDHTDYGGYHTLLFTHSLGLNQSKTTLIALESVFKTYGVKAEITISEKTVFARVFTNVASKQL